MFVFGMISAVLRDRKGISAMEYAILAAAILGVVGVAAGQMGTQLSDIFAKVIADLTTAAST